ncbi:Uncharacterised protein [Klebsiella pneumoniae]|uniref:Uncharacterized protein n=1 Tax=Yersinia enterocolitica TaxID=630 RepID=B0RKX3_YEREN|nr:hypothetical protein [Yersinia enterocolitica]SVK22608.1 Uncharacterised protein [Klebsiella pneumoniae]GCW71005.1 hypothetical protein HmCmsJML088_04124 [Escherichia coli]SVK27065.1 Uncharacterised protein [Klebsiella pneumoniae]SVK34457.1 Uncharacterised protein [Klebsiella pneumoniae]
MNGAQFQRTGGSHHLIPLILGFRQIGTTTCQFVQCTVICRFIHSPEYRFTGIGKPGGKLVSQQPEEAKNNVAGTGCVCHDLNRIQPCLLLQKAFQHKNGIS